MIFPTYSVDTPYREFSPCVRFCMSKTLYHRVHDRNITRRSLIDNNFWLITCCGSYLQCYQYRIMSFSNILESPALRVNHNPDLNDVFANKISPSSYIFMVLSTLPQYIQVVTFSHTLCGAIFKKKNPSGRHYIIGHVEARAEDVSRIRFIKRALEGLLNSRAT